MQVSMQAFGRRRDSLRKRITDDLYDRPHDVLYVEEFKNPERRPGWAKILGRCLTGAINISWNASTHMLVVRAIAKKGNKPHELLGTFLAYLFERHGRQTTIFMSISSATVSWAMALPAWVTPDGGG